MKRCSVMLVAGARPNFMKVAPIIRAIEARREDARGSGIDLSQLLVHTGQHYDPSMSDVFFRDLGIPEPHRHLDVGSGSHAVQTAKVMTAFEPVLAADRPDLVLVVGDVNSTIACAMTAKKMGVRVAHVEAGLRSFDMGMPEEINRRLTDAISDLLFVSEPSGMKNLAAEGVSPGICHFVGNVMIDSLLRSLERVSDPSFRPGREVLDFTGRNGRFALLTLHRPSNVDDPETLAAIWSAVREIAREVPVLFPAHPRTRGRLPIPEGGERGVSIVDPLGYLDMLHAMRRASLVLTDSGGLQEETTALGIPCVTLRDNTERPATIDEGTNVLAGTDPARILFHASEALSGRGRKGSVPRLWDGRASERIVDVLLRDAGA